MFVHISCGKTYFLTNKKKKFNNQLRKEIFPTV